MSGQESRRLAIKFCSEKSRCPRLRLLKRSFICHSSLPTSSTFDWRSHIVETYASRDSVRNLYIQRVEPLIYDRQDGLGRNCLAGYQPAILFVQTQVRLTRSCCLINTSDSRAQDHKRTKLLSQRTQRYRSLQSSIMSSCQLSLCHHPRRPANTAPIPLHQDHRTRTHAQQMVGEDSSQQQLLQSPRTSRRTSQVLAQIPGSQEQATSYSFDSSQSSHAKAGP